MYPMVVRYSRDAQKDLRKLGTEARHRVMDKIAAYAADPASQSNNVVALAGRPGFRLRVGDWRVIFERTDDGIAVLHIGPRGSVYR